MAANRVHLVRHAEVQNPHGIVYGRLPGYPLSEAGREHAEAAAGAVRDLRPSVILTSPLERARQTAELINGSARVEIVPDERLIEAEFAFEGRAFAESSLWRPGDWPHYLRPWRPGWAEPFTRVAARMLDVIDEYRDRATDGAVVMVGHDYPIRVTRAIVQGSPGRHWQRVTCRYVSVTTFDVADGGYHVSYREL